MKIDETPTVPNAPINAAPPQQAQQPQQTQQAPPQQASPPPNAPPQQASYFVPPEPPTMPHEVISDYLAMQQRNKENAINIVNLEWFWAFWILFLVLCIVLIESLFKSGIALGTVIWFALAEVLAISFAKYSTGKLNKKALLLTIPIALINISHLLFYNTSTQIITWPAALALFAVQLTYLSKPEKDRLFDFRNIADVLTTVFADAFVFISYPFSGLFKPVRKKDKSVIMRVLLGVVISLPIAGIFLFLFSSADESFATHASNLVTGRSLQVFITNLIIGTIMCIFVSAAFVGANARELKSQSSKKVLKEKNNVTLGTILLVVAIVIALYVVVQFNHWFGNTPVNHYQIDEFSNLARSGFFELVVASCFLLALIAIVSMISTKRNNKLVPLIKAPLLLLSACNLIVLCSAIEKMAIYIGRSGITSSRILVLWFIAIIVACITGVIIKIIKFSFRAFNFGCLAVIVLVCGLSFFNMDYYVARNHIYLAEHHKIQNLESAMLTRLSYAAAVPIAEYRDRLVAGESVNSTTRRQDRDTVIAILDHALARQERTVTRSVEENPVMGFNFSRYHAERVLGE